MTTAGRIERLESDETSSGWQPQVHRLVTDHVSKIAIATTALAHRYERRDISSNTQKTAILIGNLTNRMTWFEFTFPTAKKDGEINAVIGLFCMLAAAVHLT